MTQVVRVQAAQNLLEVQWQMGFVLEYDLEQHGEIVLLHKVVLQVQGIGASMVKCSH